MPNLNLIAESSSNNSSSSSSSEVTDELCHLLQLVLGCAVNCERKSEYIETIMEMNETTQHMIMTAIQEVNGLLLFLEFIFINLTFKNIDFLFKFTKKLMSRDRNMNVIKASSLNHLNANNASPSSLLAANSNLQVMSSNNQKYANSSNNKSVKNDDNSQANKSERGGGGGGVENNKNNKSNKSSVSNNNNNNDNDDADNDLASFKVSKILTSF